MMPLQAYDFSPKFADDFGVGVLVDDGVVLDFLGASLGRISSENCREANRKKGQGFARTTARLRQDVGFVIHELEGGELNRRVIFREERVECGPKEGRKKRVWI